MVSHVGDQDGPFNNVLEFPDIARPGIIVEEFKRRLVKTLDGFSDFPGIGGEKMLGQKKYVFLALP